MDPLKIGIVLTFKKAEIKKDELLNINSRKKKWLKLAKNPEYKDLVIKKNGKKYVSTDVAIGLYITTFYPNVIVDYITPDEISVKRFNVNDIVFLEVQSDQPGTCVRRLKHGEA